MIPQPKRLEKLRSLPSRERGLKSQDQIRQLAVFASLPSRERGLKSCVVFTDGVHRDVAPFAGAWIEIVRPMA